MAANVRYVGALSRKLDSKPAAQKNSAGVFTPSLAPLAFRINNAGIMVMKMPANSTATSMIGAEAEAVPRPSLRGREKV